MMRYNEGGALCKKQLSQKAYDSRLLLYVNPKSKKLYYVVSKYEKGILYEYGSGWSQMWRSMFSEEGEGAGGGSKISEYDVICKWSLTKQFLF